MNIGSGTAMASLAAGLALLTGCVTPPSGSESSLIGDWQVQEIAGQGIVENSRVTLTFGADGRVSGDSSCNGFGAGYTVKGGALTITQPAATLKACPQPIMDQEGRLFQFLPTVKGFRIDASGDLLLDASDGKTLKARRG